MSAPARDPYQALRHPGYRRYITGHFLSNVGRQALIAAATWQIYQWTQSITALGLVGLVNVLPLLVFALKGGTLADRFDRRVIIRRAMFASAALSLALVLTSHYHERLPDGGILESANRALHQVVLVFERHTDPAVLRFDNPGLPLLYLILFLQAIIRVLAGPSRAAIVPQLLPASALGNAITWNTSLFELSTVIGPAVGGLIVAYGGYAAAYSLDVFASLVLAIVLLDLPLAAGGVVAQAPKVSTLAGARFIRDRPPILAAMTLDLFAVVFGGVTALLPVFAEQILQVGAVGFGWLRAAPALGAALTAVISSHLPPYRRPGIVMLWAVAGFGLSLCVFSVSTSYALSFAALFLSGVCDNVSVVVRHTMVQLLTPDFLRGRVTAVNQIFIGCSNEISTLRAGFVGGFLGPVSAAVLGGVGIFGVTLFVAWKWPDIKSVPPLHTLQPDEDSLPH